MSDFSSSLPVRTENDGDVVVKLGDGTLPSQQLAIDASGRVTVKIQDSTGDTLDSTTGSLHVSVQNASLVVTATDLDIRDLSATQDNVAISDGTDTLEINADGSINVAFAPGAEIKITDGTDDLEINADGSINAVVTATDLDIRDLTHVSDSVKVGDGTDFLAVNADGSINITDNGGSITVDATDLDIRDLSATQDNVAISDGTDTLAVNGDGSLNAVVTATDLDIRDIDATQDNIAISDGTDTLAVNADGSINSVVTATDLDIRDLTHVSDSVKVGDGTDFLAVNSDGSINVVIEENPGTEVVNYDTSAAVAGGATDNHDYTSTNFLLQGFYASASGKLKAELQIETGAATNVFNTYAVQFNSTANPNMEFMLKSAFQVPAGARVRVIRTNRDNQAQDVYSTILGIEQ